MPSLASAQPSSRQAGKETFTKKKIFSVTKIMSTVTEFLSYTLIFRIGQYLRYKFYRSKFRNWLRLSERQDRTWRFSTSFFGLLCNAETRSTVTKISTSPSLSDSISLSVHICKKNYWSDLISEGRIYFGSGSSTFLTVLWNHNFCCSSGSDFEKVWFRIQTIFRTVFKNQKNYTKSCLSNVRSSFFLIKLATHF